MTIGKTREVLASDSRSYAAKAIVQWRSLSVNEAGAVLRERMRRDESVSISATAT